MAEIKHTPTPWHEEGGTIEHESGMLICTMSSAEDFPCLTEDENKTEAEVRAEVDAECKANAAFIVKAVNCHDDLLAALEWAADEIDALSNKLSGWAYPQGMPAAGRSDQLDAYRKMIDARRAAKAVL